MFVCLSVYVQEALVETQRTQRSNSDEDTATKQLIQPASHHPGSSTVCRVTLLDGNQLDVPLQVFTANTTNKPNCGLYQRVLFAGGRGGAEVGKRRSMEGYAYSVHIVSEVWHFE